MHRAAVPKGASAVTRKDGCTSPGHQGWDQRQNRRTFSTPVNPAPTLHVGSRERCLHPSGNCKHCSCKLPALQGESQHLQPTRADAAIGTQCLLLYQNDQGEAFFKFLCPNMDAG